MHESGEYCKVKKCCENSQEYKQENNSKITNDSDKIKPELEAKLHRIANDEGFTDYSIHAREITLDGNNLLGILTEVTIKGTKTGTEKKLDLFVKCIIPGKETIKIMELDKLYDKEVFTYLELAKVFNEMQDDAQIPQQDRYNFVKCYPGSNNEFIIMENLAIKGFSTLSRFDVVSLEYAEILIEQLAKFHALSFALEEKRPNFFNEHIKPMKFPLDLGEEWDQFMLNMANTCLEYLSGTAYEKFKKFIPNFKDIVVKYYFSESNYLRCLCHGDYKTNNIMKKEYNGKIDVVPVDYQLLHYGFPLTDFYYLIFSATNGEFRKKHLEHLKNLYYNTLKEFLKNFDIRFEEIYSRDKFEQLFKEAIEIGLVVSSWLIPVILADEDHINDLGKTSLTVVDFGKNDLAKVRFQEIIDNFIDWGYF